MSAFTLRFTLFARARGKNPQDIPAGQEDNAAFISWLNARWHQWEALRGHPGTGHTEADMVAFDTWLTGWVGGLPIEAETEQSELAL